MCWVMYLILSRRAELFLLDLHPTFVLWLNNQILLSLSLGNGPGGWPIYKTPNSIDLLKWALSVENKKKLKIALASLLPSWPLTEEACTLFRSATDGISSCLRFKRSLWSVAKSWVVKVPFSECWVSFYSWSQWSLLSILGLYFFLTMISEKQTNLVLLVSLPACFLFSLLSTL